MLLSFIGKARSQESKTISTPAGPVSLTTTTLARVPQNFIPLKPSKLQQIRALDKAALEILEVYRPGATPSLESYDEAFRLWQRDESHRFSTDVVERLGSYLGNRLADDFDMEWVELTDEYGTDLAVRARRFEVLSFPFSSVGKRIQNNQYDFMAGVYYAVKDAIASGPERR